MTTARSSSPITTQTEQATPTPGRDESQCPVRRGRPALVGSSSAEGASPALGLSRYLPSRVITAHLFATSTVGLDGIQCRWRGKSRRRAEHCASRKICYCLCALSWYLCPSPCDCPTRLPRLPATLAPTSRRAEHISCCYLLAGRSTHACGLRSRGTLP